MGSIAITQQEALAKFDRLVREGLVKYDYQVKTVNHKIEGIDFEFRISQALKSKPWTTEAANTNSPAHLTPRPGSDITTQGVEVTNLGQNHFLAFNGFSTYRPHYLLLTSDGYRRQWEPLNLEDFRAIHDFLGSLGSDSLVFFNCRVEGGCSRVHKHLQAIPKESMGGNPWHNIDNNAEALPFAYVLRDLPEEPSPEASLEMYQVGLAAVERTLNWTTSDECGAPPHNMIMDRSRIMIVPRRVAGLGEVGANSGGMLGMMWTQSEEHVQKWLQAGPREVLKAAGAPKLF